MELNKKVIIRADRAGVFYGTIIRKDGDEVELRNCRRIWYWNGAASLSELALSGVKRDGNKFSVVVESITWAAENCDVWGLLYWNGNKIIQIKEAPEHKNTARTDLMILSSILRRENFPAKIYNYRHQNTTIKPQK